MRNWLIYGNWEIVANPDRKPNKPRSVIKFHGGGLAQKVAAAAADRGGARLWFKHITSVKTNR